MSNNETNVNITADESPKIGNSSSISFDEVESATFSQKDEAKFEKVFKEEISEQSNAEIIEEPKENLKRAEKKLAKDLTQSKKHSYILGEDKLDIAGNAKFVHKVAGQDIEVELQDLLNNYSGKQQWDKKFQELSSERNKFNREREIIEKWVQDFASTASKGDALKAMEYLGQLTGQSPLEFKRQLRKQLLPEIEKWNTSTDEQKRLQEIQEENEFLRRQRETEVSKVTQEKATKDLERKITQVQQSFNVSDQELVEAYDTLVGHYSKDQVNPELLNKYFSEKQALDKAESLIKDTIPQLLDNNTVVDKITDMVLLKYDEDEIRDILNNSFAKRYNVKPNRKSKSVQAENIQKKAEKQPIISTKSPDNWDDL